jgi:hypothetical protein
MIDAKKPSPDSSFPRNIVTINPAPGPLPIDIHRNRKQANSDRNPSNCEEHIPRSLCREPIVQIICEAECKEILDEVHGCKSFACFLTMTINDVRDDAGGAKLYSKVYQTQADDDGDFPRVKCVGCLPPSKETRCGEEEVGYHDWEAKFRF